MILKQKIFCSKTYVLLILQFFIMFIYTNGLVECSDAYEYPCAPWILAFYFSSAYVILINSFLVIYYFSDAPFMQYYNIYKIIRYGRTMYAVENIVAVCVQAFGFMVVSFLLSIICLFGRIDFTCGWGKLLHTIALTNGIESFQIYMDISYESMKQFTALELVGLTIVIGTLVFSFVGLLMYIISLYFSRVAASIIAVIMATMAFMTEEAIPIVARPLSYVSPISWLHVARIKMKVMGVYVLPPLWYIIIFLIVGISLCISLILYKSRTVEFEFYKED